MKVIGLTQGQFALVDDADFDKVKNQRWYASKQYNTFYARVHQKNTKDKLNMHSVIMGNAPNGYVIDHIDRNGLNNQRCNLRFATHSQSNMNRSYHKRNHVTKYRGVKLVRRTITRTLKSGEIKKYKSGTRWDAYLFINKKQTYLGRFKTENEAAAAYNKAATENHGAFATINIIK